MLSHEEETKLRAFHLEHGLMVYLRIFSALAFTIISFIEFKNYQILQGMLLAFCIASFAADVFSIVKLRKARQILDEADYVTALAKSEKSVRGLGIVSLSMVLIIGAVALNLIQFQFLWVAIIAQFSAQAFELFSRTRNLEV